MASMEKYTVRGITFRYIHLGEHRVRIPLAHLDKDLREVLHKTTSQTSYTTGKSILEKNGNLICRMVPTAKMKFQQLIRKVFNLMAKKIERHQKKADRQRAKQSGTHRNLRHRGKGYRHRGALTT